MSIRQDVIDIINSFENPEFTLKQIMELRPDIKENTLRTTVGRDLKQMGYIKPSDEHQGWGKPKIYIRLDQPVVTKTVKRYKEVTPESESKPIAYSYSVIGKAIETLLEEKNQLIAEYEKENKRLEKELLDAEATIQERERHINQQTLKIHELSEKCRTRSGGSIKLDELQQTIRNATVK